jgi:hypothetical protein
LLESPQTESEAYLMKRQGVSAGAKRSDSRGIFRRSGRPFSTTEIFQLFRDRVGRLANPLTELNALREILREVRKAAGQQERADRLFFEAKNFYDGLLQGFDWGWRAAKWIQPKAITDVDRFVMRRLVNNSDLRNRELCRSLDRKVSQYEDELHRLRQSGKLTESALGELDRNRPKLRLSDKLSRRNLRQVKSALGKDEVLWLWQNALPKVHAVEVT